MQLTTLLAVIFGATLVAANGILHQHNGAVCDVMKVSKKTNKPQYIELLLFPEEEISKEKPVRIALFRHRDLKKWDLPLVKAYLATYDKIPETVDLGKLSDKKPGYHGDDHPYYIAELDMDTRTARVNLTHHHKELGMWCAYASPYEYSDTTISVMFFSRHGNMNRLEYLMYHNAAWGFFVGVAMCAGLLWYVLRFKVGSNFSNLNNLSLISKAVIFYVLLPFVASEFVTMVWGFTKNNLVSRQAVLVGHELWFVSICGWLTDKVNWMWHTWFLVVKFLFFLGYGTMYYLGGNTGRYQPMPAKTMTTAKQFFVGLAVAHLLQFTFDANDPTLLLTMKGPTPPFTSISWTIILIAGAAAGFVQGVLHLWLTVKTIIAYFATRRQIREFPPNYGANAVAANDKVSQLFRWSAIIVVFSPLLSTVIISMTAATTKLPESALKGDFNSVSANIMDYLMTGHSWGWYMANEQVSLFLTVIVMFAIWIRDNRGIVGSPEDSVREPIYDEDDYDDDASEVEEPPAYQNLQPH